MAILRVGNPPGMPPLAQVRRLKGFSLRALADASGVSVSAIGLIERGKTTRPHPRNIARIATALAVDPSTIEEFADGGQSAGAANGD